MSNDNIAKLVKFVRYKGTVAEWEVDKARNIYNDAVVFAQLLDESDQSVKKVIYAGKEANLDFEYFIRDNVTQSVVFDKYTDAVQYLQTTAAKQGQTVIVKENDIIEIGGTSYSDNSAGNYIIVYDEDNLLALLRLDNRWQYGSVDDGWHTGNEATTATVGGIAAGTLLKDLIASTNHGDLSRIIEKMLFMPAGVDVDIAAEATGNKHRWIKVVFKVQNTATDYYVSYDESKTTTTPMHVCDKTFLDTNPSVSRTTEGDKLVFTFVVNDTNLVPGRTYWFKGYGTNGVTPTTKYDQAALDAYILPTATMSQNIRLESIPNTNKLKMVVNASDFIITYNDYKKQDETKFYLDDVEHTIEEITAMQLNYNQQYELSAVQSCVLTDQTSTVPYDVSASTIKSSPSNIPYIAIKTIDGSTYDPLKSYVIYENHVTIGYEVAAAIYSSNEEIAINDVSCYNSSVFGTTPTLKTYNASNLLPSTSPQTIRIKNGDEYRSDSVTFSFLYAQENPNYVNVISELLVNDIGFDTPQQMFEYPDASTALYFTQCVTETDTNIKDLSTYVDPNTSEVYYAFRSSDPNTYNGQYICVCPADKTIQIWSSTIGGQGGVMPYQPMTMAVTSYTFTYNGLTNYKAYYVNSISATNPGGFDPIRPTTTIFIKIN